MYVVYVNFDDPDKGLIVPTGREIPKQFRGTKWRFGRITYELSAYFVRKVEEQGGCRFKASPATAHARAATLRDAAQQIDATLKK